MNGEFDSVQFKKDFQALSSALRFDLRYALDATGPGRWKVRRTWIGWTVTDPEGRVHMTTGTSRVEWRTASFYAHHAAQVCA